MKEEPTKVRPQWGEPFHQPLWKPSEDRKVLCRTGGLSPQGHSLQTPLEVNRCDAKQTEKQLYAKQNQKPNQKQKRKRKTKISSAKSLRKTLPGQQPYGNPVNFKSNWRNLKRKKRLKKKKVILFCIRLIGR